MRRVGACVCVFVRELLGGHNEVSARPFTWTVCVEDLLWTRGDQEGAGVGSGRYEDKEREGGIRERRERNAQADLRAQFQHPN